MPKRTQRGAETRPVSFRMPVDVYNTLSEIAEGRGVDISGILNWICVEHLPQLIQREAERKRALLQAKSEQLPEALASQAGSGEALAIVRDILRQMQDVYAVLSKRILEEDERKAA